MQKRFSIWSIKSVLSLIFALALCILPPLYYFRANNISMLPLTSNEEGFIYEHAKQKAKAEHGQFVVESVQIEKSLLDEGTTPYIIAFYMIQGMDQGNNHEVWISLFRVHSNQQLASEQDIEVSHRLYGIFERFEIKNKKVILYGLKRAKNDAFCCPSIPVTATLILKQKKLVLLDGNLLID